MSSRLVPMMTAAARGRSSADCKKFNRDLTEVEEVLAVDDITTTLSRTEPGANGCAYRSDEVSRRSASARTT